MIENTWTKRSSRHQNEKCRKNQYKFGMTGLKRSDKYSFHNLMLELWLQNGAYIRSWLGTGKR